MLQGWSTEGSTTCSVVCNADGLEPRAASARPSEALLSSQRRVAQLEAEVADLERECALRQEQESALKEALRDVEREASRKQLPENAVDMEYFKVRVWTWDPGRGWGLFQRKQEPEEGVL